MTLGDAVESSTGNGNWIEPMCDAQTGKVQSLDLYGTMTLKKLFSARRCAHSSLVKSVRAQPTGQPHQTHIGQGFGSSLSTNLSAEVLGQGSGSSSSTNLSVGVSGQGYTTSRPLNAAAPAYVPIGGVSSSRSTQLEPTAFNKNERKRLRTIEEPQRTMEELQRTIEDLKGLRMVASYDEIDHDQFVRTPSTFEELELLRRNIVYEEDFMSDDVRCGVVCDEHHHLTHVRAGEFTHSHG